MSHIFRSHRSKYTSSSACDALPAGSRRGLRDITNVTAPNAVKPVAKQQSSSRQPQGASLMPLPSRSSFGRSSSSGHQHRSGLVSAPMNYNHAPLRRAPVSEIDQSDVNNPMACTEYVEDIYEYHRQQEVRKMVSASYMRKQVGKLLTSVTHYIWSMSIYLC